jgi:hypothetical protein
MKRPKFAVGVAGLVIPLSSLAQQPEDEPCSNPLDSWDNLERVPKCDPGGPLDPVVFDTPEIDGTGAILALSLFAAVMATFWEKRRS